MIIYFTGTNNSRYAAKSLAERLGDTLTDAAVSIKSHESPTLHSDSPYVFVSPVYAWRLPRLFEKWIRECRFDGCRQAYFVLTCGDGIGAAGERIAQLCAEIGFDCMGTAELVMPENYIALFSAPSEKKADEIIANTTEPIAEIAERIARRARLDEMKITPIGRLFSGIVNDCFYKFTISARKFYVTDACISCGKCVDHCMLNNITLANARPVWGDDCTHCMACICKCPAEAIEYGRHTKGLRRYSFPKKTEKTVS